MNVMAKKNHTLQNSITENGKVIYLTNKELLEAVRHAKVGGEMTPALAKMLMLLVNKYSRKGNFVGYSYNEDMVAYALMMLVRTWKSFNPDKSDNPFAFYTQCIKHSFLQFLQQERKQSDIKNVLLIDQGLTPSFGYDGEGNKGTAISDDQDFYQNQSILEKQTSVQYVDTPIDRDSKGVELPITATVRDEELQ